jgi:hypothetical protein
MRTIIASSTAMLAIAVGATALASPAEATGGHCVSRSEFRRVHKGMTPHQVARLFDTRGFFGDGGAGGYSRLYSQCNKPWMAAAVEFGTLQPGPHRATGWKRWGLPAFS